MAGTSYTNPTFDLNSIKRELDNIDKLHATGAARRGFVELGFSEQDVVDAISKIKSGDFHKTMPSDKMPEYYFDVYKTKYKSKKIYVKFQKIKDFTVVSFKEDTSL